MKQNQSSRHRYREFVQDYKKQRLDEAIEASEEGATSAQSRRTRRGKRRQYLREYLRWLRPHRYGLIAVFILALIVAGLQMIEPLFMRFIIDRVLLNTGLDLSSRLTRVNLAGAAFLGVVMLSNLVGALKDYRQRLLNVRVMLSLRRSLYQRLLHLPLPNLWEMKLCRLISRLTTYAC